MKYTWFQQSPISPTPPPSYPFHLYPFHYQADFKGLENGWSLFQPEEEFAKIIYSSSMEWRISYVNIDYAVKIRFYLRFIIKQLGQHSNIFSCLCVKHRITNSRSALHIHVLSLFLPILVMRCFKYRQHLGKEEDFLC